jgi:hypothetical protein
MIEVMCYPLTQTESCSNPLFHSNKLLYRKIPRGRYVIILPKTMIAFLYVILARGQFASGSQHLFSQSGASRSLVSEIPHYLW